MPADYSDDLDFALRLADIADEVSLRRFRALDLHVETKPDLTPVSDADRAVEGALRAAINAARPSDSIVGEEFGASEPGADSGRRWIIDPIDATKNFVRGVPVWATLIALLAGDRVVVGVASAPALGHRWWAARGAGSWTSRGGGVPQRNRVSGVGHIGDASLSYSEPHDWGARRTGFDALLGNVWRTRAYGDFWSHLLVAEGAIDVSVEPELSVWDVAALLPIVEEAGGRTSGVDGGPSLSRPEPTRTERPTATDGLGRPDVVCSNGLICSNGLVHDEALALLGS